MEHLTRLITAAPPVMPQPDLRPTADAAAIARDPSPLVPQPIPASFAPVAGVNQARIAKLDTTNTTVTELERKLKPYGVNMLPQGPVTAAMEGSNPTPTTIA